jgi:hypothetical protein
MMRESIRPERPERPETNTRDYGNVPPLHVNRSMESAAVPSEQPARMIPPPANRTSEGPVYTSRDASDVPAEAADYSRQPGEIESRRFPLQVTTRELRVPVPAHMAKAGVEIVLNRLIAVQSLDGQVAYPLPEKPRKTDFSERLPLEGPAADRLFEYIRFFAKPENRGTNDCFSLASHLTTPDQPIEAVRAWGGRVEYETVYEQPVQVDPEEIEPGVPYATATLRRGKVTHINHVMVGLGPNRILAKWGSEIAHPIATGSVETTLAAYGGQLLRLTSPVRRIY